MLTPVECQSEAAALEAAWDGPMPPLVAARWRACLNGNAPRIGASLRPDATAERAALRDSSRAMWTRIKRHARDLRRANALALLCSGEIARYWRDSAALQRAELRRQIAEFAATRRRLRMIADADPAPDGGKLP